MAITMPVLERLDVQERAIASVREVLRDDIAAAHELEGAAETSRKNNEAPERFEELMDQARFFRERARIFEAGITVSAPVKPRPLVSPVLPAQGQPHIQPKR